MHSPQMAAAKPDEEENSIKKTRTMHKDGWDKTYLVIRTIAVFVVMPLVSLFLVQHHETKVVERQIQSQQEQSRLQREVAAAQVAQGLISIIAHGKEEERKTALLILSFVSPALAKQIAAEWILKAKTPAEKVFAQKVHTASVQNEIKEEFTTHLDYARQYRRFGLDANACREYFAALEAAPPNLKEVENNKKSIAEAKSNYSNGNFALAVQQLDEVFRNSPSA